MEEEFVISGSFAGNEISSNTEALTQELNFPEPPLTYNLRYGAHEFRVSMDTNQTAPEPFGAFSD